LKKFYEYCEQNTHVTQEVVRNSFRETPSIKLALDNIEEYIASNSAIINCEPTFNLDNYHLAVLDRYYTGWISPSDVLEFTQEEPNDPDHLDQASKPLHTVQENDLPDDYINNFKSEFSAYTKSDPALCSLKVNYHYSGDSIQLHYDTPRFLNNEKIENYDISKERKTFIFLTDWEPGQAVQLGDEFVKFKKYDAFTWRSTETKHGVGNFGYENRITMVISWYSEDPLDHHT
jgi:hypothetical protein